MENRLNNIILKTDSYKLTHKNQYPAGTTNIYSYFEARTGAKFNNTVFFGLQMLLKKHLLGQVVTKEKIEQAEQFAIGHMGNKAAFNRAGWEYILNKHGGRLPVRIMAVEEGTVVPVSNALMTVENTDPECFWLTNYLETLLVQTWYPTTIATLSRENKKNILKYLEETGDPAGIMFKLHDFGYRGVSSDETAGLGGAAHLVNFMGTDTIMGILYGQEYYNTEEMLAFSIPASEHSTITSWGGPDKESAAMRNMIDQYKDFPLVACVSDSYDIYNACEYIWGTELKERLNQFNGTLVVRPDSGDPLEVLPRVIKILADKFGYETNAKGYMVLNPKIRVIQGDGVDYETIPKILEKLKQEKISADNLAFGSGGGLLQKVNRDTQRFAFKCSEAVVNGQEIEVYKDPITDKGKMSKRGRLALIKEDGEFKTIKEKELNGRENLLKVVFENGDLVRDLTFAQVRANAAL